MKRIEGKIALVTGAGSGIGRATVLAFCREGATVIATDINKGAVEETVRLARAEGGKAEGLRQDVSEPAEWDNIMAFIEKTHGRLDILVNNAGLCLVGSILDFSLEDFRKMSRVNVEGVFLGTKSAVALMRRLKPSGEPARGSIINLSSIAGIKAFPNSAAYCATKDAVRIMSRAIGVELGRKGDFIRVNSVHPGAVNTPMMSADQIQAALPAIPMGAALEPEEIAAGILFLASEESDFMTAAELRIDGGMAAG